MIIWLIGISGAGKTTIGCELVERIRMISPKTLFIDGDNIREFFNDPNIRYDLEGRYKNANRIHNLCKWADSQNFNVVCCILSLFEEIHEKNRMRYSNYFEVFLDAPMETVMERDTKGLYKKFKEGLEENVVGFDIPFSPPKNPNLILKKIKNLVDLKENVDLIYNKVCGDLF